MRRVSPTVLGALAVAALAGCGQSNPDLIPSSNAQALQQTADRIRAACTEADRSEARAQIRLAEREIDALPRRVDPKLKQNLRDWIEQIQGRIAEDCQAEEEPTPEATETEAAPTETPTETAPDPTPTATATEPPVETATAAPTEPAAPPEEPTATPPPG